MSDPKPGEWRAFRNGDWFRVYRIVAIREYNYVTSEGNLTGQGIVPKSFEVGPALSPAELMEPRRTCLNCNLMEWKRNQLPSCNALQWISSDNRQNMYRASTCEKFEEIADDEQ